MAEPTRMIHKPEGMLTFLPWLRLRDTVKVGKYRFHPIRVDDDSTPWRTLRPRGGIRRILGAYRDSPRTGVSELVVVRRGRSKLTTWHDEETRAEILRAVEYLAFATIVKRDLFGLGRYCNRSHFDVYFQSFSKDSDWTSVSARRRDGSQTHLGRHEDMLFPRPLEASREDPVEPDAGLLIAITKALEDTKRRRTLSPETKERFYDAVYHFNLANSDRVFVPLQAELSFLVSAFQRAHGVGSREDNLVDAYLAIDSSRPMTAKEDSVRLSAFSGQTPPGHSLQDVWLRDFYKTRNAFSHGRREDRERIWTPSEHLLLGSFLFPLVLKFKLAEERFYQLTDEDLSLWHGFDMLLDSRSFFEIAEEEREEVSGWNDLQNRARLHYQLNKVLEKHFSKSGKANVNENNDGQAT